MRYRVDDEGRAVEAEVVLQADGTEIRVRRSENEMQAEAEEFHKLFPENQVQ